MNENEISKVIVDAAIEVHRELGGPGLVEDVYDEALEEELRLRGVLVERQLPVRIVYKGRCLRKPLRLVNPINDCSRVNVGRDCNGYLCKGAERDENQRNKKDRAFHH